MATQMDIVVEEGQRKRKWIDNVREDCVMHERDKT